MLMLEHKGIEYRRVELPTGLHPVAVRLLGFPGGGSRYIDDRPHRVLSLADRLGTVPALRIDGEQVQTNRAIARRLDRIAPDPPLLPRDPEHRAAVEEAERWGDEVLQMTARRLGLSAALGDRDRLWKRGGGGRLGPLLFRHDVIRRIASRSFATFTFAAGPAAERELLASVPELLDRIDGWIDTGVLNGPSLYAADFMIAPSLALINYRLDVRPQIELRKAIGFLDRILPEPA
jgi:glutathione S-transferase